MTLEPESVTITPSVAETILKSLRLDVDMVGPSSDDEGELYWFGPYLNEAGKRVGIVPRCPETEPCDRHKAVKARKEAN